MAAVRLARLGERAPAHEVPAVKPGGEELGLFGTARGAKHGAELVGGALSGLSLGSEGDDDATGDAGGRCR